MLKQWTVIPEKVVELLSLENLKLRCTDLLLASVGCTKGRQAGIAAALNCVHLIIDSKSWQTLIYRP